jgi:hypothetical protein
MSKMPRWYKISLAYLKGCVKLRRSRSKLPYACTWYIEKLMHARLLEARAVNRSAPRFMTCIIQVIQRKCSSSRHEFFGVVSHRLATAALVLDLPR